MILDIPSRHPLSVIMVFAGLLMFGVLSFFFLPLEELPEMPLPSVSVVAEYEGFPPREMEQLITIPMENALSSVKGVKTMSSLSRQGVSAVTLRFDWGSDPDRSAIEVREIIDGLYPYLPNGVRKPVAFSENLSDTPLMTLVCRPKDGTSAGDHYNAIKYDLKNRLKRIDGIARIRTMGLRRPEIHVEVDMERLYGMGLSLSDTGSYLGQFLIDHPAGKIREGDKEQLIKVSGGVVSPLDIAALPVQPGGSVSYGEIAAIDYHEEEATSLFLYQGEPAVGISLYKTPSGSDLKTSNAVRRALDELNDEFEGEFEIILLEDGAEGIKDSMRSLFISLVLGLTAAVIVLFSLYDDRKIAVVTSLSIPVTMVLVFFFLYLFGITLNTISLLGMVIGIGLIADNTIVILEELQKAEDPRRYGRAAAGIGPAVSASSLTTLIVFLPPLFIPGISAILFRDLILTIVFLISLSLFVSLFFAPALYTLLAERSGSPHRSRVVKSDGVMRLERRYKGFIMGFLLRKKGRKRILLTVFTLLAIFLAGTARFLPVSLLPDEPESRWIIQGRLSGDWSALAIEKECATLCRRVNDIDPGVRIYAESGYEKDSMKERASSGCFLNQLKFHLYLPGASNSPSEDLRAVFNDSLLEEVLIYPVPSTLESALLPKERRSGELQLPVLRFLPDLENLSVAGLNAASLQSELQGATEGIPVGEVSYKQEKITVRVRGDNDYLDSPDKLLSLKLPSGNGFAELGEFVRLEKRWERGELARVDRKAAEEHDEAPSLDTGRFIQLYIFALFLMFMVLGIQTESIKKTIILFIALPLSLLGALIALLLCRFELGLYGFIGILIMQGTVINTAILLLDRVSGSSRGELAVRAGRRIRPIISTTGTTVCALISILVQSLIRGSAEGAMAAAVLGGMLIGTFLILVIIPLLYGTAVHSRRIS